MDWVFILAVVQVVGMRYVLAASDGWHYVDISVKKRKVALMVGMAIIWIPFLLVWAMYGHSPADLWTGANAWWNADIGLMGYVIAIAGWWMLLSPFQALFAIWSISRATRREQSRRSEVAY
jgi:hypothetical protein